MKRIILISVCVLMSMSIIISCKEEDERDKFTGTWTGNLNFDRIGTEYPTTVIITKSTINSTQIQIGQNTATVNGDSYTYVEFKSNLGIAGNYAGTGTLNGDELNESGLITSDGSLYQGDLGGWGRRLIRQ